MAGVDLAGDITVRSVNKVIRKESEGIMIEDEVDVRFRSMRSDGKAEVFQLGFCPRELELSLRTGYISS